MLALLDGLAARGLLGRAQRLTAGAFSLDLVPQTASPEQTTKDADRAAKAREEEERELMYASS